MDRATCPESFSLADAEDHLVWIFGSSRSGSTWLLRMLSSLPGVIPIDDPHLGHHLGVWRPISLAWAAAEQPPDLSTLDRFKRDKASYFFNDRYRTTWVPSLRRLIVDRFDAEARDTLVHSELASSAPGGSPVVVVKEPGSHVADHLVGLFPASRVIFLLRDGRDVVDSWLAAYRSGSWALDEGAFAAAVEGREALVRWQSAVWAFRTEVVQKVYDAHPPDRRVLVRYEDLVANPARELRRVGRCLPIKVARRAVGAAAEVHDFARVPLAERGEHKSIRSAQPGNWRDNMTLSEQAAMHEIMGPRLIEHGYLQPESLLASG